MVEKLLQSTIYQLSYSFCLPTSPWLQPRSFNYSPISNDGGFLSTMGGIKLMTVTTRDMDYLQKKLLVSYRAFAIMELILATSAWHLLAHHQPSTSIGMGSPTWVDSLMGHQITSTMAEDVGHLSHPDSVHLHSIWNNVCLPVSHFEQYHTTTC